MIFFINDNNESISYDGEFLLTKQAVSFYSFKIKADVSINFTIPNTSETRKILGYHGFNQNGNPAYSELPFSVSKNGNILAKGYIVITSDNGSELECFFVSGNTWINNLNTSLKRFDYNQYTVYPGDYIDVNRYTVSSTIYPKEYGIIFPIVDWAYEGLKRTPKLKRIIYLDEWSAKDYIPEMLPVVYLHTVMSEVAKQSNIKLEGDIFDDLIYKRIVITPETADLQWPDYFVNDSLVKANKLVTQSYTSGWTKLDFENRTYPNNEDLYDGLTSTYKAKYTGIYSVQTKLVADYNDNLSIRLYIDGSYVSNKQYASNARLGVGISNGYVYLEKGQTVEVYMDSSYSDTIYADSSVSIQLTKSMFYDPIYYNYPAGPYIPINAIVPDIKAIDLIKFVVNYFGCVAYFDQYTQTLTINKSSVFKDIIDWSDKVKSYQIDYNNEIAQNNYIRFKDVDDYFIRSYNEINPIGYGNGNITADRIKTEREIYTLPFAPTADIMNDGFNMQLPSVGLIKLSPKNTFQFTSVTNDAGFPVLNGTFEGFSNSIDQLVYVNGNTYNGYYLITGTSSTTIHLDAEYIDTDSGTVSTVQKDLTNSESRILLVNGQTGFASISDIDGFYSPDNELIEWMPYAWFYKQQTGKEIDNYKDSLAINDLVNANYGNRTISEAFYQKLTPAFQLPGLSTTMLIDEKTFQEFNFKKLVYLNTGAVNGYFFVEGINNYKDGTTLTSVNLVPTGVRQDRATTQGGNYSALLDAGSYTITGNAMTISRSVSVSIQMKAQYNTGVSAKLWYKVNSGTWTVATTPTLTTSYSNQTFSVTLNDTDVLYIGVTNNSNTNVAFGTGNGGSYFGYCGKGTYSINPNITGYINVAASAGGYTIC